MRKTSVALSLTLFLGLSSGITQASAADGLVAGKKSNGQESSLHQVNTGVRYLLGMGVLQDYEKAVEWFRKGAAQDDPMAQYNLGRMYEQGKGVTQDKQQAFDWYLKAAEQGLPLAEIVIGDFYALGNGVPQDEVRAYAWYSQAAEGGNRDAAKLLEDMSSKLSPEQLSQAKALAAELQGEIGMRKK